MTRSLLNVQISAHRLYCAVHNFTYGCAIEALKSAEKKQNIKMRFVSFDKKFKKIL